MQRETMSNWPKVSIVIPHYGESSILYQCLTSLRKTDYPDLEIIISDNGSDFSLAKLADFPFPVHHLQNGKNLGFAGGCNVGMVHANGKYIVLLNNDTTVDPTWLKPLVLKMEFHPELAAVQPKLLSMRFKEKFDYAGGMGGLMDIFGYPFAIGRIFDTLESDRGQYNRDWRIFWASGTASLWRRSVLDQVGLLDEDFFAHMEEIDLNWRCHLAGFGIASVKDSTVYHYSGYSLDPLRWKKMYLNHRNNLMMLLKNYEPATLLWLFPLRLILELITVAVSLISLNWKRAAAVIAGLVFILFHVNQLSQKRKGIQKLRRHSDSYIFRRLFRGSIVWQYFVRRKKTVSEIGRLHGFY